MFNLPELPYDYPALEPYIDTETMHFHHDKHHASYVKNLNEALTGQTDWNNKDVNEIIREIDKVPEEIRTKVRNNAGGHANHSLYWEIMCAPTDSGKPSENLEKAINQAFGDLESFKEKFSAAALGRFGSGWAWLVIDSGKLAIMDTSNQDSPLTSGKIPILLIDVWEHAYYLKYKNLRGDYIKAWWNIVNWKKVSELFDEGMSSKGGELK